MVASFVTTRHALCPILVTGASSRHGERNRDDRAMRNLVACTGWKARRGSVSASDAARDGVELHVRRCSECVMAVLSGGKEGGEIVLRHRRRLLAGGDDSAPVMTLLKDFFKRRGPSPRLYQGRVSPYKAE
ncbi:hypothetical protein MRX96_037836 [Rhipicephalus microplus]